MRRHWSLLATLLAVLCGALAALTLRSDYRSSTSAPVPGRVGESQDPIEPGGSPGGDRSPSPAAGAAAAAGSLGRGPARPRDSGSDGEPTDGGTGVAVAEIVRTEWWPRKALWSRPASIVQLPGRFPGGKIRVWAEVVDGAGSVVVARRECEVLRHADDELLVVVPTGPDRLTGHVRVWLATGAERPLQLEFPLPAIPSTRTAAEGRARRLLDFPGDSSVHLAYVSRIERGISRRTALLAARAEVEAISSSLDRNVSLSPPREQELFRQAVRRIQEQSLSAIDRLLREAP